MSIKVCVIGCGYMAGVGHGPSFRKYAMEHEDVVLAACCDTNRERAEGFCKSFGFERAYTDINQMVLTEKPDAVSLIVPPALTASLSIQMMEAGIPVILEKPPGMNREETLQMIEVAKRTGTPNLVSFNRRYMPVVQGFRKLRNQCKPQFWQYDFYRCARRDLDFSTTSIHGIDTLRYLVGADYKSVHFQYISSLMGEDYVPTILLDCEFVDGQNGRISFVPTSGYAVERCTMHGGNEIITAGFPFHGQIPLDEVGILRMIRMNELIREEQYRGLDDFVSNGFYDENAYFFDCIRLGKQPAGDIESGLQAVEIADCIRQRKAIYTI